jgi:tetratricopeptide (TPR) repeat protein
MGDDLFDEIQSVFQSSSATSALEWLAERLKFERRFPELFNVRLLQTRLRFGLPIADSTSLENLPEATRTQVEQDYLDACREVGWGLMDAGQVREAWRYLQPTGQRALVATALAKFTPDAEQIESLVEIALYEGVAPELGFQWLLSHYGICNAITAMETVVCRFPRPVRQTAAAMLVRRMYDDLLENIRRDLARSGQTFSAQSGLGELVMAHPNFFADQACHVDASHLAAVVRAAVVIEDLEVIRLALELAQYGRMLHADCQFAGEEPFCLIYPGHERFFAAQLGAETEEALEYFRGRAELAAIDKVDSMPAEVYITLLTRLGRYREAIEALRQLQPVGQSPEGLAPTLFALCQRLADYSALLEASRRREDLTGFLAALICTAEGA